MDLHSNMVRFIINKAFADFWNAWVNLHSNMVRFIIIRMKRIRKPALDLHSNMVRFIIEHFIKILSAFILFTFQYG